MYCYRCGAGNNENAYRCVKCEAVIHGPGAAVEEEATAAPGDYGGQRANMEDATMVGTLAAQAAIVWPHERDVLARRASGAGGCVLDIACGTGEILRRFRETFRPDLMVGVDLYRGHLARAEGPVLQGDAHRLPFAADTFDLALIRHVLQAIPEPLRLMTEARRVLRVGGRIHLLVEDYQAILFDTDDYEVANHFVEVSAPFRPKGTDLYQGRRAFRQLCEAGFSDVQVDPFVVDTTNSERETFADVFRNWREGYAATLAGLLGRTEADLRARFDAMIETVRDEKRYTAWLLFAVSGVKD